MTVRATELRKGTVIVGERGELLLITEYHHHTPGNLRAVIHAKVKNLASGTVTPLRWGSSDAFEVAYLDKKKCEYLYKDSTGFHFMDQENYETLTLGADLVGDDREFLTDNLVVQINKLEGRPFGIQLPTIIELAVASTEPAVRGDTASGAVTKAATLETGLEIRVPLFIKEGEKVKVHTETREFAGRA